MGSAIKAGGTATNLLHSLSTTFSRVASRASTSTSTSSVLTRPSITASTSQHIVPTSSSPTHMRSPASVHRRPFSAGSSSAASVISQPSLELPEPPGGRASASASRTLSIRSQVQEMRRRENSAHREGSFVSQEHEDEVEPVTPRPIVASTSHEELSRSRSRSPERPGEHRRSASHRSDSVAEDPPETPPKDTKDTKDIEDEKYNRQLEIQQKLSQEQMNMSYSQSVLGAMQGANGAVGVQDAQVQ